jgi:hypothetical protein
MMSIERADSLLHRSLNGFSIEYGELEVSPFAHTIGTATHLVPELPGRVGGRLPAQASSAGALHGFLSKRDLHFFKQLFALRLRKTNDQSGEARQ